MAGKRLFLISMILAVTAMAANTAIAVTTYLVEVSHNDELFVINDEIFKAQTYCFDMEEGDMVIFLSGNPNGLCTSAELLNLRTKERCAVWCE